MWEPLEEVYKQSSIWNIKFYVDISHFNADMQSYFMLKGFFSWTFVLAEVQCDQIGQFIGLWATF